MKVLQINSVCGIGSTGRIATNIHDKLIEDGHESYIGYGRPSPAKCNASIRIGNNLDNYMHVFKTRFLDMHGFGSKTATLKFIEEVEKLNPDIIHLHNLHGYYVNIKILFDYLKKAKKPVIWTLHDCWAFTGHKIYIDKSKLNKGEKAFYSNTNKFEYPKSIIFNKSKINYFKKKEIFSGVDKLIIVTPSAWLASLVKNSFLKNYEVKIIHNGIDLSLFKPQRSNFRENYNISDKFVLLSVSNVWNHKKGFNDFFELSKKLLPDEIIVLIGVTPRQKKQLPNNIIGITKTDNIKELAEIYSAADLFINFSREDNFPTVNLESLACGTKIVTYDTGGSKESIDSLTGKILSANNVRDSILEIRRLKNTIAKNTIDLNCVMRAEKFFSSEKYTSETISLYKETLGLTKK